MPMHSVVHTKNRLVVTTGKGHITLDDVLDHQKRLQQDPDFNPDFDVLMDGTEIIDVALSVDEIRRVLKPTIFSPRSRIAFVVSSQFMFGMARMTQTYLEMSKKQPSPMTIFQDRSSALRWLGIPDDSGLV